MLMNMNVMSDVVWMITEIFFNTIFEFDLSNLSELLETF